jgi:hypothetical protein
MTIPLFGEYAATHPETKNITLFDSIEDQTQEELTFTMIHELTHGLLGDYTEYFRDHIGFWIWATGFDDEEYDADNYDGEQPPTDYGKSAPEEDLAECVAMYFSNNTLKLKLKREYPEHYKLVESILAGENIINLQAQRSKKRR